MEVKATSSPTERMKKQIKRDSAQNNGEPKVIGSGNKDDEHNDQGFVLWKEIGGVRVTVNDKERILNGEWLTDTIIHAAQLLERIQS